MTSVSGAYFCKPIRPGYISKPPPFHPLFSGGRFFFLLFWYYNQKTMTYKMFSCKHDYAGKKNKKIKK